jgi:hypothetical protein
VGIRAGARQTLVGDAAGKMVRAIIIRPPITTGFARNASRPQLRARGAACGSCAIGSDGARGAQARSGMRP